MEFDPFDYDFHRDPYPTYQWLRDDAPLYHNERMDFWAVSRFDDVLNGLHDPGTYTSTGGVAIEHTDARDQVDDRARPTRAHADAQAHRAPFHAAAHRRPGAARVREWTNALLDRLDGRDEFDVVREFTALLPTTVVGTMLGIPADRHDDARQWTDDLLTREPGNAVPPPAAAEGAMQIAVLAHQLAAARRERPAEDILTTLVEAEIDGAPLTDQQVIGFCLLLITGGHETTSKLIANGVRLFASHPEQRDALIAEPERMEGAVEELLRFTSPTQYMARTTTRPVDLHDTRMPAGAKVVLLLGAGNRDPREFDRPDEFDVTRTNPRILAFGHGAHVCLGAAVARLEARDRLAGVPGPVPAVRRRRRRDRVPPLGERAGPDARPGVRSCLIALITLIARCRSSSTGRRSPTSCCDTAAASTGSTSSSCATATTPTPPTSTARSRGTRDEYVDWVAGVLTRFTGTMHVVANQLVELDGDDDARSETYGVAYHWGDPPDDQRRNFTTGFRYVDRFARRDGDWRIARRVARARVDARRHRRAAADGPTRT